MARTAGQKVEARTKPSREIQKVQEKGLQKLLTAGLSATGATTRVRGAEQNAATLNMFAANVLASILNTTARQEDLLTQLPVD